jgi:predicted metal-binding protein
MDVVDPPVSTGLILICDKCGKRMKAGFDENPSRELVARLKKASKDVFGKGQVRAALTSCLDLCPDNRISVAIVPTGSHSEAARYFTVKAADMKDTGEKIIKEARRTFSPQRQVKE